MKYSIEELKKKFPNIARELLEEGQEADLTLRVEQVLPDPWRGYIPGPIDYIRRCKKVEEAYEVIEYLVRHGELSREDGEKLKTILREKGLEYFGKHKEDNYYYKKALEYWKRLARITYEKRQQQS